MKLGNLLASVGFEQSLDACHQRTGFTSGDRRSTMNGTTLAPLTNEVPRQTAQRVITLLTPHRHV
jgi:hypothetical protein